MIQKILNKVPDSRIRSAKEGGNLITKLFPFRFFISFFLFIDLSLNAELEEFVYKKTFHFLKLLFSKKKPLNRINFTFGESQIKKF